MPMLDYLIKDGLILTGSSAFPDPIQKGMIGIREGRIHYVGPYDPGTAGLPVKEQIDAAGFLILPGLVNTHSHAPMTLFRGLADDLPLKIWLEKTIVPAEAHFLDRESVYWGTLLACAEMILSGTTTFADGYFFMDRVAQAVERSGMRALLCPGILDFPIPGIPDPSQNILSAAGFVEDWQNASPRIQTGLFCHSAYTCSPETLKKVKAISRRKNLPFYIHLAETREEVSAVLAGYGRTPVRHLHQLDLLDDRTVAVHAIHLDPSEIDLLSETGTAVAHCPESNMKLASGIAPVLEMQAKGIRVGLGTDGSASNNDLDLFGEMAAAARLEKVHHLNPTVLDARTVVRMATLDGAGVIGLGEKIGSLEKGKEADLILIDLAKPHLTPLYNVFSNLVYSASGADVHTVMVGGRMLMRNRSIVAFDLGEVLDQVKRISRKINRSSHGARSG